MDITLSTTRKASKFDDLLKYKATPFDEVNVPASTIKRGIPWSNLSITDVVSPKRECEKRVDFNYTGDNDFNPRLPQRRDYSPISNDLNKNPFKWVSPYIHDQLSDGELSR